MEWELGVSNGEYFLFLIQNNDIVTVNVNKKQANKIMEQFNIQAKEYPF